MLTSTGKDIDLRVGPRIEQISLVDIAQSLGSQVRFAGQCKPFYSVAEHSVRTAYMASDWNGIYYLLHDAHETYYQDFTRPLKDAMPKDFLDWYKEMCDITDQRIMSALRLDYGRYLDLKPAIKKADIAILKEEQRVLFGGKKSSDGDWGWLPQSAERQFLNNFKYYRKLAKK